MVLYDILAVLFSGYLALCVRFDFSFHAIPERYEYVMLRVMPYSIVVTILIFIVFRLYSSLWTYAGMVEIVNIAAAGIVAGFAEILLIIVLNKNVAVPMPRSYYFLYTVILMVLIFLSRFSYRGFRAFIRRRVDEGTQKRALIIGAGAAGNAIIREIKNSSYLDMKIIGVIDDNPNKIGNYIHGIKVIGNRDTIIENAKELDVDIIILAIPTASAKDIKELLNICKETGCELKRLPGIYQLVNGEVSVSKLKDVDVNDLLGREPIQVNDPNVVMNLVYIADVNMCYSEHARRYLNYEGTAKERTYVTGSPMAEVLHANLEQIEASNVLDKLGLEKGKYILLSAHREENIDTEENFNHLFTAINAMAEKYDMPILYSCHPRSKKFLEKRGFQLDSRVKMHEPLGFHDYNHLQMNAFAVVSDSGTLPEESSYFNSLGHPFPAVCIRTSTERPEALDKGNFILAGITTEQVLQAVDTAVEMVKNGDNGVDVPNYVDENVSTKVVKLIQSYVGVVNKMVWRK